MWNESWTLVNFKNNKMPWKLYFTTVYLRGKKRGNKKTYKHLFIFTKVRDKAENKDAGDLSELGRQGGREYSMGAEAHF